MHTFSKDFDSLSVTEVQQLIDNQVSEKKSLDYKQKLPGTSNDDRKEFLADICSFANVGGGHIFYGITEERGRDGKGTGLPEKADGLSGISPDAEILRLEGMVRDGISPRIPLLRCRVIPGFPSGPIIVVQIGASWVTPHMVIFQNSSRFFARGSNGKFQMDVQQIRSSVLASDNLSRRIRDFRADRIGRIVAGEELLDKQRRLILHLVPLSSFGSELEIGISKMKERRGDLVPISQYGYNERVNLDGFRVFWDPTNKGKPPVSYTQIYRTGMIEAVDTMLLENDETIPTVALEKNLNEAVKRYLTFQKSSGVPVPVVMMLTLTGVKGLDLAIHRGTWKIPGSLPTLIDRDILVLPERIIPDYTIKADQLLRPIYDSLYNAAGRDACPHYDKEGSWAESGG